MSLRDIFQGILSGPPPSDNTQQIANQLGPDNPLGVYMMRRHWGSPTPALIQEAANYGLRNRAQTLDENQFNARTYTPTQTDYDNLTTDNPLRWLAQPGQQRYIDDINKAYGYQDNLNQQNKYNSAVDSMLSKLQGMPGVDPNNPVFLMASPDTRGAFNQNAIGQDIMQTANTAYQKPLLDAQKQQNLQQLNDYYDGFVQSMVPDNLKSSFMLPGIKSYYMNNPEAMQKLITTWTPQPEKQLSKLDQARLGLIDAQTAAAWRNANEPYRYGSGSGGGRGRGGSQAYEPGWNEPSKAKIANNLRQEYKITHKVDKDDDINESDFRSWILQKKGPEAWRQYMYESTGDSSVLGLKCPQGYNKEQWDAADRIVIKNGGVARALRTAPADLVDTLILRYNMNNGTNWNRNDWANALRSGYEVPHRR